MPFDDTTPVSAYGSMFIARPHTLRAITPAGYIHDDFPDEARLRRRRAHPRARAADELRRAQHRAPRPRGDERRPGGGQLQLPRVPRTSPSAPSCRRTRASRSTGSASSSSSDGPRAGETDKGRNAAEARRQVGPKQVEEPARRPQARRAGRLAGRRAGDTSQGDRRGGVRWRRFSMQAPWTGVRSVATSFSSRANSIGFFRWLLAFSVIFSHAGPVAGFYDQEDLGVQISDEQSLGGVAVAGFFFFSGFLITRSRRRTGMVRYFWRRCLRIMPAFWTALLLTGFVLAPIAWHRERARWRASGTPTTTRRSPTSSRTCSWCSTSATSPGWASSLPFAKDRRLRLERLGLDPPVRVQGLHHGRRPRHRSGLGYAASRWLSTVVALGDHRPQRAAVVGPRQHLRLERHPGPGLGHSASTGRLLHVRAVRRSCSTRST